MCVERRGLALLRIIPGLSGRDRHRAAAGALWPTRVGRERRWSHALHDLRTVRSEAETDPLPVIIRVPHSAMWRARRNLRTDGRTLRYLRRTPLLGFVDVDAEVTVLLVERIAELADE